MSREQWGHGFFTGMNEAQKKLLQDGPFPVGMFFIVWENGKQERSGFVIGSKGEYFLLKYFSALDGCLTREVHPFKLADAETWSWYATDRDMRFARYEAERWSEDDIRAAEMIASL